MHYLYVDFFPTVGQVTFHATPAGEASTMGMLVTDPMEANILQAVLAVQGRMSPAAFLEEIEAAASALDRQASCLRGVAEVAQKCFDKQSVAEVNFAYEVAKDVQAA